MGRFFQALKQKTLASSSGPTSAQLQQAGQTIFIEAKNAKDLEEVILVQKAHYLQTQNGAGLPHPGLSAVVSTSIPDSGAATSVLVPTSFQVLKVVALSLKNASGSDASVQVSLTDGTTSVILSSGTLGDGSELPIITPLFTTNALGAGSGQSGINLDSSLQIKVASNQNITANCAYQSLSVA